MRSIAHTEGMYDSNDHNCCRTHKIISIEPVFVDPDSKYPHRYGIKIIREDSLFARTYEEIVLRSEFMHTPRDDSARFHSSVIRNYIASRPWPGQKEFEDAKALELQYLICLLNINIPANCKIRYLNAYASFQILKEFAWLVFILSRKHLIWKYKYDRLLSLLDEVSPSIGELLEERHGVRWRPLIKKIEELMFMVHP